MKKKEVLQKATATPAILIITAALLIVLYAIIFVLGLQFNYSNRQVGGELALHIAEAGINYYKWHLAHDPEDFTDGTGQPGPYEHEYRDPEGKVVGKYSLEIIPPSNGSSIVTISSTGWTYQYPNIKRVIKVQYGIPSFARYSFLANSSMWFGSGVTVNGLIHSNNGVRMDGTNTSLVTSSQETYMCGYETGCFPPQQKPGVWGSGGDKGLWQFPVPQIDFDSISLDLTNMKNAAQTNGLYLPESGVSGYHIIFTGDGKFTLKKVNSTTYIRGYSTPGEGIGQEGVGNCRNLYQVITNETVLGTYTISTTPIVFAEDNLWVEGVVKGRITVVSASFPIQSSQRDIWIPNNITYTSYNGSDVLGLVSQDNIFFARDVPENFQVDAVLMAQKGKIIRHRYYPSNCGYSPSHSIKDSLTINGALINYYKSYWNFTTGGSFVSGFITRTINYDTNLLYAPPPYFPTSGEYEFISWQEEK
jgi:hypothetical protein